MSKSSLTPVDRVNAFKAVLSSMPINYKNSDNSFFEHFSGFINSYHQFFKAENGSKRKNSVWGKCNYHLEKLWSSILSEFMSPMWCYDESGYNESLFEKQKGPFNIYNVREVLRDSFVKGEFAIFFKAYPFVKDLLSIDEFFTNESKSREDVNKFLSIMNNYKAALDKHDALLPILVLKEHINLMLSRDEFDKEFYSKHMKGAANCLKSNVDTQFLFLSMLAGDIPYSARGSNEAFKKFNWGAFDSLHKAIMGKKLEEVISSDILNEVLESIENYLENLILFEIGEADLDDVPEVDISDLDIISTETNIKPAFEIVDHYLEIAELIEGSDSTARLATLRVITAVGEAIFVIKSLIPAEKIGLLEKLNDLRDHIVHSSTNESFKYLLELVNSDDSVLDGILVKLKSIKGFFAELKLWLESSRRLDQFPDMPDLTDIEAFEADYAAHRKKDDRHAKLSLADCSALEKPIPDEDVVNNGHIGEVVEFARNLGRISRTDFMNACRGSKKLNTGEFWENSELKKVHEKITELNKVKLTRLALNKPDFDFDKVSLNLKKSNKAKLKTIKEQQDVDALNVLLDQHEIKNAVNIDEFLQSVENIHLAEHKEVLRKFANEEIVSKRDFEAAVQVVFRNDAEAQLVWNNAYTKYHGEIDSLKRDQLAQVEYAVESIDSLKTMADEIHDGRGIDIRINPVVAIACEMQYGLCTNNIKTVTHFIERMYDYDDKSLYFICLPHPIKETQGVLDLMVTARNDLFHFERTFAGGPTIEFHRMIWFSILENLTHGMFFPEGIIITPSGVSREPMTSDSNLMKLKKYLKLVQDSLVQEDTDTINVYAVRMADSVSSYDSSDFSVDSGVELTGNVDDSVSVDLLS